MSIRNRLMANRFGYDSQYTQMEAISDYVYRGRDYYAMPDMEKRFLRTRSDYNTILSLAKENYVGTEDPDSYEARLALGQIIHQLYPTIDATYAAENAEELMYQATGYKTNVKGLKDQFVNTFHSAGSSLLASMKIANLYIQGAFSGYNDEEWLEKKEEAKKDLTKYAMNYRTDLTEYDNAISRLLSEPATATAEILPSMLPSLGISALALAVSVATGGSAIPATTAGLIKAWNTLSGVQKATAAASIGGRFFTSAMMEMGGSALDMMNAGFDDDVIFGVSALVGLTNGVLETVGDKAIDTLLKPFSDLANAAGRETANKIIRTSIKDTIREFRNETGKSILSESTTEVLQEFSSMFGYNMAVNIQKERNMLPEGVVPYTAEDFRNAAYEVAKSTAMGTAVLGGASGMLRFAGRYAGGELRRSLQADKYTKADGATARIATSIIDHPETTIAPDQDVEKQSPISVVRIGDRYRAFYTNDEENAAISRSKQVYVREIDYSTETAIGKRVDFDTVDMHAAVKRSVVEDVINKGLDNGKLAGFTYYNKNLQRVTNPSQAAYISLVESKDSDPIMIPLSESSNITAVQLQKDIYGETIDKITSSPEIEVTPAPSSSQSSPISQPTTGDVVDANYTDPYGTVTQPETIVADVDEQPDTEERQTTFTDEDLVEAEAVADDLVETAADESVETDTEETQISTEENQETEVVEPQKDKTAQVEASQNVSENNEQPPVNTVTENATVTGPVTNTENAANTDTRTPEQKRIDEDTERRNQRNQARINAQNEWDQVQRTLTGTDSAKDINVLTVYFSSILGQTRLGESAQAVEASARAAAEVAVGFAKASGMKGEDYFKTINAFMSEDFVPSTEDGTTYSNDNKLGWFLRDNGERYINIMRNADPSTLIHELGHHFLSVLAPDMPAYNLINEVYAKSIEKDGGVIGRRTNEAFARDLEKYVYFRKSSNGRLNAIFQKLYDVAKALWQTLKGDERLSSQKVKMFDAIFAEEQDSTASIREVADAADKVMASDSETKMSDLARDTIGELAQEESESIVEKADTVIESVDNEISEVIASEGVDLIPEAEPEEVSAWANTVEVPQTEEEKASKEPVQKIEVESETKDTSLNYVVEIDLNTIGDDPKFYTKKIREGKVDSKKLESQFKEKDKQEYFDEITEQYKEVIDSPIVGMGNKVNIYTAISSITGIPNLDTDFAEFFYAEDGGIYVLLNKDIRVNEDETETYLADKPEPKFWKIPLTGKDSIEDITYEYYLDNKIPEVVEREYILDTEGNKIYREEVEAEPTDDKDKIDAEKFSDTEENPDEVIDYDKEKRVKRTFKGYSDPFVTAIPFAVSYQNNPEFYFSSNDTEAVHEAAEMIEERLSDTELINTYSRFEKYINALKDKLEKDFDNEEAEVYKKEGRFDLEELKANYVQRGIADELQLEDPDASITDQFAAYLGIAEKSIKDNMAGIPSDMQENVLIKIANDLIDTSKSYLATGRTLRNGLSNPNHFNKAVDLLRNLVQAISKSNNVTRTRDSIATMLRNSKAANALDTDKPLAGIWLDVYTAFQKDRNTGSVSEDQVRTLIDALVDEKGIPRFITETKDGAYYTSPLIVLSNFYSAKGENVNKSTDSFSVASERYLNLSQQLLKDKLQESGIVNISKDNADAAFQSIFAKIRNKMGNPFLQTYFENRVTMNKVEALSAALVKKIDSLKKQAEDTRKDPETIKKLMASEREVARLNESIAKLKEAAANSKGDISELKKQLQKALKDNDALKKVITDLNSIGSVADLNQKIQDLEHQADVERRKYERMIEARNLRIAELNKRVDYLLNHAPEIKTARELQEELDTIIKSIYSRANSGNKRVGQQLSEIYDFLSSDVNTPYDSNIFESRWSEFSGFYDQMRRFVERVMIQDGKLARNLNSLTVQELAELDDIVDIIVGFGTDEMNYRKMQEDTKWARRLTYAIRGIPKFKDLEFNHEAMDELIDKLKSGSAPGSVDDQIESGILQKTISEFTQIENALKAINPALHNIIFGGGLVEGERIADNLNSAQEEYVKNVNGRRNEVAEAFTKYFKPSDFGLKIKGNKFSVDDFNIYQERVFRNKRTKLGRMSIAEFEAKHGSFGTIRQHGGRFEGTINLNPDNMWYELARRVISEEVKYRRDQIRFKNKPEDLTYANKRFKKIIGEDENTRIDKSYTMENIMGIYLLAAQKDGLNRLIINPDGSTTTNNLSIENILWVIDQFTDGEFKNYRKFAHSLQHIISSRYGALSDVYYLSENELLENIPYYFAIRDARSILEEVNTKELKLHSTNVSDTDKLDTSFLKERANPRRAADLNVISIAMDEIKDQEKYITQAVLLNRYSSMFRKGGDLELALENAYGEKGALLASSLRRWVGQIIDENNRTAKTSLERVISKLRGNMVRSVLWAAPSVILQQFPSYILVARRIGLNNATRYLFNTIHNRRSVAQLVYSKSKQMKDRARIETAEYKQRAGEFTKDPIFMKKLQHTGYKGLALSARENFEKAVKWGMDLQQKADTSVANAMWMALYEHYSKTMEKGNLSDAEFDTMVSEKATQEVLSLQPSQYAKDNAIAYNSRNEALKSLLLFTSSLNKEFNMIYEDFLSGRFNGFTREKILGLVESFMYISLVSLGTALVSGRILPDDDDDRELKATIGRLAQGTMSEAFNIIPAIGPIVSDIATGEVYYDTGTAGTFINLIRTIAKDPEKRTEGQLRRAISKSFVEAFQLAGIPSNTPNKILTAVIEKNPFEAMNSQWGDYYKYIME